MFHNQHDHWSSQGGYSLGNGTYRSTMGCVAALLYFSRELCNGTSNLQTQYARKVDSRVALASDGSSLRGERTGEQSLGKRRPWDGADAQHLAPE